MVIIVTVTYIGLFIFEDIPTLMVVGGLVAQVRPAPYIMSTLL